MRILFTAVAAHGHVLPLAPLIAAALEQGHAAALVTSAGLSDVVARELADGVEHLPAGPMPVELATEAARRSGEDIMAPSVDGIGETFGGVLLDLAADDALAAARRWSPDLVVSELYCTVGPLVATALQLPLHEVRMTAPLPAPLAAAIARAAEGRYARRGLRPRDPDTVLDLWPVELRDPAIATRPDPGHVLPVRATPHRRPRPEPRWSPPPSSSGRPRVLVTLGTIFSGADMLTAVVDAVAGAPVDVVATLGLALGDAAAVDRDRTGAGGGTVTVVGFVPIDELLDDVDLVVGVGGAGTVLAALGRAIPLVLWPRGADHPTIAAGVAMAGAGVVVDDLAAVGPAVARVLDDPAIRAGARSVAESIARAPGPAEAVRVLTGRG
ncbi:glycosyltransferase [Pseudonocardia sp. TMWB2A]|uniref:nucleotide disphospho-sugar-binding domain-containing protein n=1 Tax=Pseudonocardia sp. TMWB2A TaxID=687430 RepID=UPI00307E67FE